MDVVSILILSVPIGFAIIWFAFWMVKIFRFKIRQIAKLKNPK